MYDIWEDEHISLKAKGLWGYINSKPDNFAFAIERFPGRDGKDSIRSGIKELELHGYLARKKTKNEMGFFEYKYILVKR